MALDFSQEHGLMIGWIILGCYGIADDSIWLFVLMLGYLFLLRISARKMRITVWRPLRHWRTAQQIAIGSLVVI